MLQDISDLKNTFSLNLNQIISSETIKDKENEDKVCKWKRDTLKEYSILNLLLRMQKLNNTTLDELANMLVFLLFFFTLFF